MDAPVSQHWWEFIPKMLDSYGYGLLRESELSYLPTDRSQALDRSQLCVNGSYSGDPLHMATLTGEGTNVL